MANVKKVYDDLIIRWSKKKPNFVNIVCERPLTLAAHYVSVLLSCSKNGTMGLRGVQPGKFSYCDSSRPQAYLSGGD